MRATVSQHEKDMLVEVNEKEFFELQLDFCKLPDADYELKASQYTIDLLKEGCEQLLQREGLDEKKFTFNQTGFILEQHRSALAI